MTISPSALDYALRAPGNSTRPGSPCLLTLFRFPAVFQANSPIENQLFRGRVRVAAEIPGALKLAAVAWFDVRQSRFHLAAGKNFEGIRIELFQPVAFNVAQTLAQ